MITKAWNDETGDCEAALRRSLERLNLDYVDLYLVHWPISTREIQAATETSPAVYEKIKLPVHKVWPQMEALVEKGLTRSIGTSNFNLQTMWDLLSYSKIPPAVNEMELHPFNP